MAFRQEIKQLFEDIAVKFFNHSESENHFVRNGVDEMAETARSNLHSDILIFEGYDFKFSDSDSHNVIKKRSIGFFILKHIPDSEDYNEIDKTMDELERKGDKVLNYFNALKENIQRSRSEWLNSVFQTFEYDNVDISEVQNMDDNYYGYFYTVTLGSKHNSRYL